MTASSARERLLTLIAERSFRLGDFTLSSGLKSDYYIDCRTTTLHAAGSELTGRVFLDLFREQNWNPDAITLHEIQSDIGEFLGTHAERYDFIHMSHVIEHIPKYSLFWVVDALYNALRKGGVDFVPHLIDDNSGVGTQVVAGDINGDGLPDVVVGNKKGAFIHLQQKKSVTREEWEKAQPKPLNVPSRSQ